jgi:hypothetical protein
MKMIHATQVYMNMKCGDNGRHCISLQVKKWMGVRLKPLCVRSGGHAAADIHTFQVGHVSMCPVGLLHYHSSSTVISVRDYVFYRC